MIKEEALQLIWEKGLFRQYELKTTCGKEVYILSAGTKNLNAGPDFFNAKIRIGKTVWAGNVEAHLRSSDWKKHGHHLDGAYNNVILHVVCQEDAESFTSLGRKVDTLLLTEHFHREQEKTEPWLHCHEHIQNISDVRLRSWLTRLQGERLEGKCKYISGLRFSCKRSWEETLILVLASAMGQPLNSLPFELTLRGIPLDTLLENRDKLQNLEAILFGQAGFLSNKDLAGPYEKDLYRSYSVNLDKFRNGPIDRHMWKFLRLRPASFPTLRISQFASLIHTRLPLLETIFELTSLPELEQFLRVESSSYWNTHYLFGKCSNELVKVLGNKTIMGLIINGLVPFLFSYGHSMHHETAIKLGTRLLLETEAESNWIIKRWGAHGIKPIGAFESQALIHLHNVYCLRKRCCDCHLGAKQI